MAFKLTCDLCGGNGNFEFENDDIFIVCEDCGQEREINKRNHTYLKERLELVREQRDFFKELLQKKESE